MKMKVLVVAEFALGKLRQATRSVVAAGLKLADTVDVLVAGTDAAGADEAAKMAGVAKVVTVTDAKLAGNLPEALGHAAATVAAAGGYTHLLFAASSAGKSAMPRAAAELKAAAVSEVTDIVSPDTFKRFIYAGGILATVKTSVAPVAMTVRTTVFEPVAADGGAASVEAAFVDFASLRTFDFVKVTQTKSDRPDLVTAKRVVAAGRGIIDEAGFAAMTALADKMGAAVGSTRAIVDMQIAPNETQVGQTGKIVAPELYIAFGISGAIQHVAGMKDSKVIVAVNNDPEAPIFEMCDYGLVADAGDVVKALTAKL